MAPRQWTPTRIVGVIAYAVMGIGIVILFAQNARQDAFDARREADIAAARAETVHCIQRVIAAANDSTTARTKAAQERDDALVGSKRALRELIRLRVIEQVSDSEPVRQAAEQYMYQTQKFIEASAMLNEARRENPVPDIEKECG